LQKIVAVKDVDSTGTALGIRFMSSDAFTVSFTTVAGGLGLKDGSTGAVPQGAILASEENTGGGRVAIATQVDAEAAVTTLAEAVAKLGAAQAVVGKGQNQFSFAISLASTQLTNLAASESRIRDADLAAEAANLTKAQILQQAGIAAMAQANSAPQVVLSLLQG
jgi:flagellin